MPSARRGRHRSKASGAAARRSAATPPRVTTSGSCRLTRAADTATQRSRHGFKRPTRGLVAGGPADEVVDIGDCVAGRRIAAMPGQGAPVDGEIPAAACTAWTDQRLVAERHVAVFTRRAVAPVSGSPLTTNMPPMPSRDDQVKRGRSRARCAGTGLGQSGQRGVVTEQQPDACTIGDLRGQRRKVDVIPSSRRELDRAWRR